jgi:hypothetical protein
MDRTRGASDDWRAAVTIRTFRPGDEAAQAVVFNAATAGLPGAKPAHEADVRRRFQARDFDPTTRYYAEEGGEVVGYCSFHHNGRVSYPWCLPGFEHHAEPLFAAVLDTLQARGARRAFAAYHNDWPGPAAFFPAHGLPKARDMVNFVVELTDMPTLVTRSGSPVTPLTAADLPTVHAMAGELWRGQSPDELRPCLFNNPYFPPEALFAVRARSDQQPLAVGILVEDPSYADPMAVDATQPCFRLGAFGTEGLQHKRINGLFSFVVARERGGAGLALDLLGYAATLLDGTSAEAIAAQVPSDVPHLLAFYQSHFRRQGSFPVYERVLSGAAGHSYPAPAAIG